MFRAGLEIHQQLDTKKLFCSCDSYLSDNVLGEFVRTLRPVQSELGEYDAAALLESKKSRTFIYQITENSCLVEMDEEPPHPLNMDALEIAITVSLLLHCKIVDEVHFMRKIVIDGSNTSGFQRTALIGLNGYIDTEFGRIDIPTVCLEEEAARKIDEKEGYAVYRLDRLGIPLIEISTAPQLTTPEQVKKVAEMIGFVLRSTKRVKRGLGSIRQDLNISIDGKRVEVKGVSRLNLLEKISRYEAERQKMLLELSKELKDLKFDFKEGDVTNIFNNTKSKIIKNGIENNNRVYALYVSNLAGYLKSEKYRLGKELAEIVRVLGIGGLFHTDELPAYGISEQEVNDLKKFFNAGEKDAIIFVVADLNKAKTAISMLIERIKKAKEGITEETRGPRDDGTTEFLRPLPGRERMYPETDIPPVKITEEMIERIRKNLPKSFEETVEEFSKKYGISKQQAYQIINNDLDETFVKLYEIYSNGNVISRTLINTISEIEKDGYDTTKIDEDVLSKIFLFLKNGYIVKDGIPYILRDYIKYGKNIDEIAEKYRPVSEKDLREFINKIIKENESIVKKSNAKAILMGTVMEKLSGRADGSIVNRILDEILKNYFK